MKIYSWFFKLINYFLKNIFISSIDLLQKRIIRKPAAWTPCIHVNISYFFLVKSILQGKKWYSPSLSKKKKKKRKKEMISSKKHMQFLLSNARTNPPIGLYYLGMLAVDCKMQKLWSAFDRAPWPHTCQPTAAAFHRPHSSPYSSRSCCSLTIFYFHSSTLFGARARVTGTSLLSPFELMLTNVFCLRLLFMF